VLAEGRLALDPERWRSAARRSGGWLSGQTRGTLAVRVAAESGTFAVPFEGALMVQVLEPRADGSAEASDEARPLAGAHIEVELDGAALAGPSPLSADTGLSRVALRPEEHAVSARVVARAGDRHGEWYGALPVTPGALSAAREGNGLLVRSPIARALAFVSVVTWNERLAGAIVPLTVADDGSASGRWALDAELLGRIEREACWVVVSSEYDKRSAGAVGWPLTPPGFDPAAPGLTFDVADAVLLDGRARRGRADERVVLERGATQTGRHGDERRHSRSRPHRPDAALPRRLGARRGARVHPARARRARLLRPDSLDFRTFHGADERRARRWSEREALAGMKCASM
jgi:hypothetical protein